MPDFKLCIMVDGEGHFRDTREIAEDRQKATDDNFNMDAIGKGLRVLRLHYLDKGIYNTIVQFAVSRCCQGIFGYIDFSKSYGPAVREAWGLPPLPSKS